LAQTGQHRLRVIGFGPRLWWRRRRFRERESRRGVGGRGIVPFGDLDRGRFTPRGFGGRGVTPLGSRA
jgi:hypothetical protein